MAKVNMSKKYSATITGVLDLSDGIVKVCIEDVEEPVILADFIEDFADKEVKISVSYGDDLG